MVRDGSATLALARSRLLALAARRVAGLRSHAGAAGACGAPASPPSGSGSVAAGCGAAGCCGVAVAAEGAGAGAAAVAGAAGVTGAATAAGVALAGVSGVAGSVTAGAGVGPALSPAAACCCGVVDAVVWVVLVAGATCVGAAPTCSPGTGTWL